MQALIAKFFNEREMVSLPSTPPRCNHMRGWFAPPIAPSTKILIIKNVFTIDFHCASIIVIIYKGTPRSFPIHHTQPTIPHRRMKG